MPSTIIRTVDRRRDRRWFHANVEVDALARGTEIFAALFLLRSGSMSSTAAGFEYRYPWASSQPRLLQHVHLRLCLHTLRDHLQAEAVGEHDDDANNFAVSASVSMREMKARSIFSVSTGKRCRRLSEE